MNVYTDTQSFASGGTIAIQDLAGALQKQLTLRTSAGSAFAGFIVQASPDGATWENVDGTTFTTLGTAVTRSAFYQDRRRYWRGVGSTAAGSVTVQAWWNV